MDKYVEPDDKRLAEALGVKNQLWEALKKHLSENYDNILEEWKFYGQKHGWTLKVKQKKRTIFYLIPFEDAFKISFVFGDKAVAVAEKSDLPKHLITALKNARKYMEGRGLQVDIERLEDIENIKKLVEIKMTN
jgi:hypothetical protein